MPLLTSPGDYDFIAELLRPMIEPHLDQAVLLLAHGTNHPSWTCYLALEHIMRKKFGETIFVGTIEKLPDSQELPEKIAAQGVRSVFVLPFLLVAGTHFFKDIRGDSETCWEKRLQRLGLKVEIEGQGLGLLPGIEQLIAAHIRTVLDQ
jgi:sirohydrochlorin cobaltochelatase